MEIKSLESESSLVIAIKGLLDTSHSQDLDKFIESKIGLGFRKFLFDFTQLESLSSGGIGFIIRLIEKSKSSPRIYFAFTGMNIEVQRLFRFFGLEKRLNCFKSIESAREFLSRITPPESKKELVEPSKELTINSNLIPNESLSNTSKQRPVRDRIQFYYKGSVTPSIGVYNKPPSYKDKDKLIAEDDIELVSKLESVETADLENHVPTKQTNTQTKPDQNNLPIENITSRSIINPEESIAILTRLESKIDELKENLFNSNSNSKTKLPHRNIRKVYINCESCGVHLKVHSKGQYKCPSCRTEFYFNGINSVSNLEKLT